MSKSKCYLIRHLKRGILTDSVYLEEPTEKTLVEVCGEADVKSGLVRIVTSAAITSKASVAKLLEPLVEPPKVPESQTKADAPMFKITIGGKGTVTPPKAE